MRRRVRRSFAARCRVLAVYGSAELDVIHPHSVGEFAAGAFVGQSTARGWILLVLSGCCSSNTVRDGLFVAGENRVTALVEQAGGWVGERSLIKDKERSKVVMGGQLMAQRRGWLVKLKIRRRPTPGPRRSRRRTKSLAMMTWTVEFGLSWGRNRLSLTDRLWGEVSKNGSGWTLL